jgi:hypothetical protein
LWESSRAAPNWQRGVANEASPPPGPRRVFVGKNDDRGALVSLADAQGKPRLVLTVNPASKLRIEFLDWEKSSRG